MRQFSHSHSLHHLPWASKMVTTWFLVIMLLGCIVTVLLAAQTSGFTPAAAQVHYAGDADGLVYGKSLHELLETAHFHLFSIPVVLLIVGHLMGLTRFPNSWKAPLISGGFVGFVLNLAMPFLIGHMPGPWASLKLAGNAAMGAALCVMCVLALLDLHLPLDRPGEDRR